MRISGRASLQPAMVGLTFPLLAAMLCQATTATAQMRGGSDCAAAADQNAQKIGWWWHCTMYSVLCTPITKIF